MKSALQKLSIDRPRRGEGASFGAITMRLVEGLSSPHLLDTELVQRLVSAFDRVPRHQFVEHPFATQGYQDASLPIGFGQTISKPSTVGFMLSALAPPAKGRVLEVGAGCGYVSALFAELGLEVYAIERIGLLAQRTRLRLDQLKYQRILLKTGDGLKGWMDYAPFDRCIVSAALSEPPMLLLSQLKIGGRMIAPLITRPSEPQSSEQRTRRGVGLQQLMLWEREGESAYRFMDLGPCSFVPAVSSQ